MTAPRMSAPRWAAVAILAALAIALVFDIDHPLARFAAGAGPALLGLFRFISWFGQGGVVLVPSGLALLACLWLRPRLPSLAGPIRRLIRQLPERQRVALVLRYFDDLTDREVARAMGCRPGTARSLISRGLAAVRATLSPAQLGDRDA